MTTFSEALATIFATIAVDFEAATQRNDREAGNALIELTVALEKAYPDEMRKLREEAE